MIKTSLRLSFIILLKEKVANNIFLISSIAFTLFVTSYYVLPTNLNLKKKKSV